MLNRLALRLATVRALRGRTLAGNNVLDSTQAAIDDIAASHPTPVIVVYTDDGQWNLSGRNLYATSGDNRVGVGQQRLVIEMAVTQRMLVPQYDETGTVLTDEQGSPIALEQAVPLITDAALELTLDVLEHEVLVALQDGATPWSEMWKRLVVSLGDKESQRGQSNRDGVRFAGRQITLSVDLASEPAPGALTKLGPVWSEFLALARTEADLPAVVPLIERALIGSPPQDAIADIRSLFGLNRPEADALLLNGTEVDGAGPTLVAAP